MLFFNPKLLWLEVSIRLEDTEVTFNDEIEAVFQRSLNKTCNITKKEFRLGCFSYEFCEIF